MENQNFSTTILVDQSPKEVFNTILNVREWWFGLYDEKIEGTTDKLNGEFTFHAGGGVHYSKQKLIELIPGEKVVWLVTDSKLTFLKNESEWTGTQICFEISKVGTQTQIVFTHIGVVPKCECYRDISSAWSRYMGERLVPLLVVGKE